MAPKENVNALRTLVISMGFLLVGGIVFLMAVVWKKVTAETAPGAAGSAYSSGCTGGMVDLKGKGTVIETTVEGRVMRITTEKSEGKTDTYLVDMCSGKVITHLALESDTILPSD